MTGVALALAVALAGGTGSAARFLVDEGVPDALRERYPWGTTVVNLTGSLALGLLVGVAPPAPWVTVVGTGLIGGYTTFSTASLETIGLWRDRRLGGAALHGVGMLAACLLVSIVGLALGRSL